MPGAYSRRLTEDKYTAQLTVSIGFISPCDLPRRRTVSRSSGPDGQMSGVEAGKPNHRGHRKQVVDEGIPQG